MGKILLLEDDSHYREIIERVLSRNYPYTVTSVATEMQAWEELSKEDFDLVLLDLYIDGRSCWETLKRVVSHPAQPVAIVLSLSLIHISEPTRLRRISYAVFCLKKKKKKKTRQ